MAFVMASQAQHKEATEMDEAELAAFDQELKDFGAEELPGDVANLEDAPFG